MKIPTCILVSRFTRGAVGTTPHRCHHPASEGICMKSMIHPFIQPLSQVNISSIQAHKLNIDVYSNT